MEVYLDVVQIIELNRNNYLIKSCYLIIKALSCFVFSQKYSRHRFGRGDFATFED